jgi:two-component system cell cycle sensor histidine kinase/response regulator CckA
MPDSLPPSAGREAAMPHSATATVLIVTADEALRVRIQELLARAGLTCLVASSGQAALEPLGRAGVDLLLIDLPLPDLSDQELLERQCKVQKPVPFIALVELGEERHGLELMRGGALDCLLKDAQLLERLPSAVHRTLQRLEQQRHLAAGQEALRQSEARHRALFELASVGMMEGNPQTGRFLRVNEKFCQLTGYSAQELQAKCVSEITHPEKRDADWQAYQRAVRGETRDYRGESRYLRQDGSAVWVRVNVFMIRDAQGHAVHSVGVVEDITERKRAEEQLAAYQAQLEEAQALARLGSWHWDIPTGTLVWSHELYRIFGRKPEEFVPTHEAFLELVHPEDRAPIEAVLEGALSAQRPYDCEVRIVRPDHSLRVLHTRGRVIFDARGKPLRMFGTAQDITARKRVEGQLRASEERFQQLAQNIGELFWIWDREQRRMLYVSPAYETICGRSCESLYQEAEPRAWLDTIHPEDRERLLRVGAEQREAAYDEEFRIVRPDGAVRWIHARAFPVREPDGQIKREVGSARDITAEKEAAAELRRLEEQLRQAQKMEALGRLAGGVAHDFNNLLAVIAGHSELLTTGSPGPEEWRESVAEIGQATQRAAALTRQLLAFSRREIQEPKVLDLNAVVADAEKMLRRLIGEHVQLTLALQADLSPIRADLGQLNQVLLNLAVNARDAMPRGGRLRLETREVDLDAAAPLGARSGRHVRLTVTDTGCGMTPEVQARVFEPFFTTKAEGLGTGLGLSVVLGIVQQSGGRLAMESQPGVGTAVHVDLPAVPGPAERPPIAPAEPVGGGETVLLVEDAAAVRRTVARMLEYLGYRVLQAESGPEALRLFEARAGQIDLLLTDVVMPGLSGRELADALRLRQRDLKVLFQSGYTDDAVMRWGVLQAEMAFLKKPFTLEALAARVREALGRS